MLPLQPPPFGHWGAAGARRLARTTQCQARKITLMHTYYCSRAETTATEPLHVRGPSVQRTTAWLSILCCFCRMQSCLTNSALSCHRLNLVVVAHAGALAPQPLVCSPCCTTCRCLNTLFFEHDRFTNLLPNLTHLTARSIDSERCILFIWLAVYETTALYNSPGGGFCYCILTSLVMILSMFSRVEVNVTLLLCWATTSWTSSYTGKNLPV
jgi:hypothetical protein